MSQCNEYGGRIVDAYAGFHVCEGCGLCFERVYQTRRDAYHDNVESDYHKEHRERKMMARQRKESMRKDYRQVRIWRDAHEELKNYCKKNDIKMSDFASEAIKWLLEERINEETLENQFLEGEN